MTYFEIILACLIVFIIILSLFKETRGMLKEQIKNRPFLSYSLICLTVVAFAFLYFPLFFKYIALEVWDIPVTIYKDGTVEIVALADLGPIGDIFGSLNSFISSIALCAVAFSTWLQVTSLKETRRSNREQFLLTKEAHDEQIKESKNAIFTNQFFSILNYKREKFNSIYLNFSAQSNENGNNKADALIVMQILTTAFTQKLRSNKNYHEDTVENIRNDFLNTNEEFFSSSINPIISYFYMYKNLIKLIDNSGLEPQEKAIYIDIVSNSMFQEEQMLLFWIAPLFPDLKRSIDGSKIFNQIWYEDSFKSYGLKFHVADSFRIKNWISAFKQD